MKQADEMPVDQAALDVLAERFRLTQEGLPDAEQARIQESLRTMLGDLDPREGRDQLVRLAAAMIDMVGRMDAMATELPRN